MEEDTNQQCLNEVCVQIKNNFQEYVQLQTRNMQKLVTLEKYEKENERLRYQLNEMQKKIIMYDEQQNSIVNRVEIAEAESHRLAAEVAFYKSRCDGFVKKAEESDNHLKSANEWREKYDQMGELSEQMETKLDEVQKKYTDAVHLLENREKKISKMKTDYDANKRKLDEMKSQKKNLDKYLKNAITLIDSLSVSKTFDRPKEVQELLNVFRRDDVRIYFNAPPWKNSTGTGKEVNNAQHDLGLTLSDEEEDEEQADAVEKLLQESSDDETVDIQQAKVNVEETIGRHKKKRAPRSMVEPKNIANWPKGVRKPLPVAVIGTSRGNGVCDPVMIHTKTVPNIRLDRSNFDAVNNAANLRKKALLERGDIPSSSSDPSFKEPVASTILGRKGKTVREQQSEMMRGLSVKEKVAIMKAGGNVDSVKLGEDKTEKSQGISLRRNSPISRADIGLELSPSPKKKQSRNSFCLSEASDVSEDVADHNEIQSDDVQENEELSSKSPITLSRRSSRLSNHEKDKNTHHVAQSSSLEAVSETPKNTNSSSLALLENQCNTSLQDRKEVTTAAPRLDLKPSTSITLEGREEKSSVLTSREMRFLSRIHRKSENEICVDEQVDPKPKNDLVSKVTAKSSPVPIRNFPVRQKPELEKTSEKTPSSNSSPPCSHSTSVVGEEISENNDSNKTSNELPVGSETEMSKGEVEPVGLVRRSSARLSAIRPANSRKRPADVNNSDGPPTRIREMASMKAPCKRRPRGVDVTPKSSESIGSPSCEINKQISEVSVDLKEKSFERNENDEDDEFSLKIADEPEEAEAPNTTSKVVEDLNTEVLNFPDQNNQSPSTINDLSITHVEGIETEKEKEGDFPRISNDTEAADMRSQSSGSERDTKRKAGKNSSKIVKQVSSSSHINSSKPIGCARSVSSRKKGVTVDEKHKALGLEISDSESDDESELDRNKKKIDEIEENKISSAAKNERKTAILIEPVQKGKRILKDSVKGSVPVKNVKKKEKVGKVMLRHALDLKLPVSELMRPLQEKGFVFQKVDDSFYIPISAEEAVSIMIEFLRHSSHSEMWPVLVRQMKDGKDSPLINNEEENFLNVSASLIEDNNLLDLFAQQIIFEISTTDSLDSKHCGCFSRLFCHSLFYSDKEYEQKLVWMKQFVEILLIKHENNCMRSIAYCLNSNVSNLLAWLIEKSEENELFNITFRSLLYMDDDQAAVVNWLLTSKFQAVHFVKPQREEILNICGNIYTQYCQKGNMIIRGDKIQIGSDVSAEMESSIKLAKANNSEVLQFVFDELGIIMSRMKKQFIEEKRDSNIDTAMLFATNNQTKMTKVEAESITVKMEWIVSMMRIFAESKQYHMVFGALRVIAVEIVDIKDTVYSKNCDKIENDGILPIRHAISLMSDFISEFTVFKLQKDG